jgi:hypothetical protein
MQENQIFVQSVTDSLSASFPSPESYNLVFLTAILISVSSIIFAILLNRSMSKSEGNINEVGIPS